MSVSFSITRVVDYWTSYPFSDFGDNVTKIYKMRCVVNEDSYTTLETGVGNLTSAATAGVHSLPASFIDVDARFCNDSETTSLSGGVVEFVRTFANIPADRTDYSTAVRTYPPEFEQKITPTLYALDSGGNIVVSRTTKTEYVKKPAESKVVSVRLEYRYGIGAPTGVKTEEGFTITKADASVSNQVYFGDNVIETDEGQSTVTVTGDAGVILGTESRQWLGDINEFVTGYAL